MSKGGGTRKLLSLEVIGNINDDLLEVMLEESPESCLNRKFYENRKIANLVNMTSLENIR